MTTYPAPAVGARVRHITHYADGTNVIIEGSVYQHELPDGILIGSDDMSWYASLSDRRDRYTVELEVLEEPLPPEPPIGAVIMDGGDRAWQRVRDDRDPQWRHDGHMCSWETLVREFGPLTHLIPDPADQAPELPWRDPSTQEHVAVTADDNPILIEIGAGWRTPEEARTLAAALLRAAREATEAAR